MPARPIAAETRIAPVLDDMLSQAEILHYSRQLILPELGTEGQRRLKRARVLIVGAGGLGAPTGLYLAAAGVGSIGIVDADKVDASNLHRQVIFDAKALGLPKTQMAARRLRALNPHIDIQEHPVRLSATNALDIIDGYDLVIDATDNFASRYLINDACALLGKPDVSASIYRFEGQISVFHAGHGPCYRCLYPKAPPADLVPSCAEAGVLGVLPGIIGSLQANEAIKHVLGIGQPLLGRLLTFDALTMRIRDLAIAADPYCPLCNDLTTHRRTPTATLLACEASFAASASCDAAVEEIDPRTLAARLAEKSPPFLLDVRTPTEAALASIEGGVQIPLSDLEWATDRLPADRPIVCYCHKGARSLKAARLLQSLGMAQVASLRGGIDAWSREVDLAIARY